MEKIRNIFEELKHATSVGSVDTSMQSPDLNTDVLGRALAGQAAPEEVLLWLHETGDEAQTYTVGVLQAATTEDENSCWTLPSGKPLWID